ncbi:Hypothetical protein CINCED_3A016252 [Cinara cedri]|uniref:GOLD domain-containing protein n=1 Tax=Cinara cedri TaxID=506608 RepID=A0A5E4MQK6_9HEMI|nr:Hypothetical protein CINCED_3A016252 [Cinara cedri]
MQFINHLTIVLVLFFLFSAGSCIRWHMQPNSFKCFREELRQNVLVKGVYVVNTVNGQTIDYVIKDSKNHVLSQKEDISSGKFSFSIENDDVCEICFISKVTNKHSAVLQDIFLDIKTGIEAKNSEAEDEATKLKPLELSLKNVQELSQDIIIEFSDMKTRADNLRKSTRNRIICFGIITIISLITLSAWQVYYLKQHFKVIKLID